MMQSIRQTAAVIFVILALPVLARPAPWPPDVAVSPQNPTTSQSVTLTFSDIWPDNCVPKPDTISYRYNIEVDPAGIYVTIRTPSYFTCTEQATSWRQDIAISPLRVGCYDVYVALEDSNHGNQPFTKVATFCVKEGSGAPDVPWPPDVTVSPQNPAPGQSVKLTFSDTWPDSCVPVASTISYQYATDAVYVTIETPSYFTCLAQETFWQQQIQLEPLGTGCYDVYVALEDVYHADQPFVKAATFCIGDDSGGPEVPWPPMVAVSPESPSVERGELVTLTLSGTWPDNCVPTAETTSYEFRDEAIYVKVAAPLYITCLEQQTAWKHKISLVPPAPGVHDVYVELADPYHRSQPPTRVATLFVSDPGSSTDCWPLYVLTRGGIRTVSSSGAHELLIEGHQNSHAIEVRARRLYATDGTRGADIRVYDLQGQYIKTIPAPSQAKDYLTCVALPGGRFALLDNLNDKVFFIDEAGSLLATTAIRPWADNAYQSLDGVVVGGRLILSEDGYHNVLQIDLATYEASVFKDLSDIPDSSLLSIEYAEGTYYVSTGQSLYAFTETGAAVKVADVPEKNITSIVVAGQAAYVSVNFSGKIYKIDLIDGTVSLLASGLDYPMDLECVRYTAGTEYFEVCAPESMHVSDRQTECWTFTEPWLTSFPPKPTWAPPDAVVTRIEYRVVIGSALRCADYEILIDNDPTDMVSGVVVYDNLGGLTDMGYDDDAQNDRDIELDWRKTKAFNGQSVHQNWTVCFEDTSLGYAGTVTELCLRIYWERPGDQGCCGLEPGDRVVLLVDQPRDAEGLLAGTKGTVVCCDRDDPDLPVFVSWDNWMNGRNSDSYCDASPLAYVPYSGWWMACEDMAKTGDGGQPGGGGGSSDLDLVFCVNGDCTLLGVDPSAPASSNTYIGSTPVAFELNFRGWFIATVTPTSAADGTWTAWLEPDVLGPGTVTAMLWVRGENLNLAALPAGGGQIQVADLEILVAPAF